MAYSKFIDKYSSTIQTPEFIYKLDEFLKA